jgi:uncharacterized protein YxjI
MDERFADSRYLLVRQFLKLFGANFRIFDSHGRLALFCNQKAFRLREDIRVYSDETRSVEILHIQARNIIDFSAAYDVIYSPTGEKVGALKRKGWSSLVRDSWVLMDADDREIGSILEDSMGWALLRRFVGGLVPQRLHVDVAGRTALDLDQRFNPFLYKLDISFPASAEGLLDRRLGIAAAILIAAIEGRQD